MAKDVRLQDFFDTLRIYLGSLYVNDFNLFGRTWQVIVQADAPFRIRVEDARRLKVRNTQGTMVPVAALADVEEVAGPLVLSRYNMYPAAPINGSAAPGVSSGTAIQLMEQLARSELLPSMTPEWTELAYLELQAGNTAMIIFAFAVIMVFLVLAAQYESWSMPLAVILVVPMCLLSAIVGVRYTKSDINIFTQIGFVVLVGLTSKNAILMVEFAKGLRKHGQSARQAALDACRLRVRPIIMTSLAFILGVVPLITSNGAGAEMRHTLGTTVFSGMVGVTIFGIFLTPIFFVVVDMLGSARLFRWRPLRWASNLVLSTLSLRFLWRLAARTRRATLAAPGPHAPAPLGNGSAAPGKAPTAVHHGVNGSSNGHAEANGHSNGAPAHPVENGSVAKPSAVHANGASAHAHGTASNGTSEPSEPPPATEGGDGSHSNGSAAHSADTSHSTTNGSTPASSRPDRPLNSR
jgi:multidrug efflux pump